MVTNKQKLLSLLLVLTILTLVNISLVSAGSFGIGNVDDKQDINLNTYVNDTVEFNGTQFIVTGKNTLNIEDIWLETFVENVDKWDNYYLKSNPYDFYNSTTIPDYILSSNEGNLNVNYSDNSDLLDGQEGSYYLDNVNNYVNSVGFSGTDTKTLTLGREGLSDLTASFTDRFEANTDTNASTACTGLDTFLSGDGTCETDSDTTYTAGDYLYLSSTQFNVNETELNSTIDDRDDFEANTDNQTLSVDSTNVNDSISISGGNSVTIDDNYEANNNTQLDDQPAEDNVNMSGNNVTGIKCMKGTNGGEWCFT